MKILLILPYDIAYRYHSAFIPAISYQPLTLSMLAALIPQELNAEITLIDEGVQQGDYAGVRYDIVGISSTTSSAPRAYELAAYFRSCGSYVLLGGHHVSLMPEEAQHHGDSVFVGSAEHTFPQFFSDYKAGMPQRLYVSQGVDADAIPIPRRDLMGKRGYLRQPTIIADYGCPNSCKYCVIHRFWGNKARRSIDKVIAEIQATGAKEYLFLDPSPFGERAYAVELLERLAEQRIRWAGLAALDIAEDEQILALLQKSGCVGLLLGFETFNAADLADMAKSKNKVSAYKDIVRRLHSRGMAVLGTFMIGFDGDTQNSLAALPRLIDEIEVDIPRFAVLTPYPNTPLHTELAAHGRILTTDWSRYDSIHCVHRPLGMTAGEVEQSLLKVWRECYTLRRIGRRLRFTPQKKLMALATNIGFRIYTQHLQRMLAK